MALGTELHEEVDVLCVMEESVELDHVWMVHRMLDSYLVAQLLYHLLPVFPLQFCDLTLLQDLDSTHKATCFIPESKDKYIAIKT